MTRVRDLVPGDIVNGKVFVQFFPSPLSQSGQFMVVLGGTGVWEFPEMDLNAEIGDVEPTPRKDPFLWHQNNIRRAMGIDTVDPVE